MLFYIRFSVPLGTAYVDIRKLHPSCE